MDLDSLPNNSAVKIVDFGPFLNGSDRQGVSNAILDCFQTTGFVYLINHGLSQNLIESMFFWVSPNGLHTQSVTNFIYLFWFP